jgi:hypothetical protein
MTPEKNAFYCAYSGVSQEPVVFIDRKEDRPLEREYEGFGKKGANALFFKNNLFLWLIVNTAKSVINNGQEKAETPSHLDHVSGDLFPLVHPQS